MTVDAIDAVEAVAGRTAPALAEIPIYDVGPYLAGEDGALDALAAQVRYAQEEIGFYYIINHGVPQSLIDDTFAAVTRYFALPAEEKLTLKVDHHQIGYIPPKASILKTSGIEDNKKPDTNEAFQLVHDRTPNDPKVIEGRRFSSLNKWPDEALVPGFRAQMLAYHAAMRALGWEFLAVYARALDLPADWFHPYFADDPHYINRNAHYAPVETEEGQYGLAAHSDHGFMTFLPMQQVPGLEIKTQDGRWIAAPFVPGAMLVNTGEFLNRWSNERFLATPHRVLAPAADRYAITFFYGPCDEARMVPPETCVGPDNPPKFEPVTFLEYMIAYSEGNYLHQAAYARAQAAAADN